MVDIEVVEQQGRFRLVRDETGRAAVIEVCGGMIHSLEPPRRRSGLDTPAGICAVIGPDGWVDMKTARARLKELAAQADNWPPCPPGQ